MEKPDIYEFDDFRQFLSAYYHYFCSQKEDYSWRKFALDSQITNPGYLNDVIKNKRKLSKSAYQKVVRVFEIQGAEEELFHILVNYGQSKDLAEKEEMYRQILFRRSRSKFTRLNPALVKYYQDYQYPLVRAAIEASQFKGNYEELARFIDPPLPANMVKKIVRELCEWGLVKQDSNGQYLVTSKFVEPPATLGQLVRRLNRIWLEQSAEAIHRIPAHQRNISSVLLAVSEETQTKINHKIQAVQAEIFKLIEADQNPEVLMQLSIAYFPKSKRKGKL